MEADIRKDERRTDDKGHTYQRAPNRPLEPLTRNAPPTGKMDGWRVPTSTEGSDGSTTQAPELKWQEDAVNKLAKPSDRSDRDGSRHQGDSTPKLEFGGETIKLEVRRDGKWTDGDGHTCQRVPSHPLDLLTRDVLPTGETDDLRVPACRQSGYPRRNDLETRQNGRQRAVKEGKGQPNANGIEGLPWSVETDDDKSCNVARSPKAATESCDLSHMVNTDDTSTKGLTALYNAPGCRDLRSTAVSNEINNSPAHPFGESDSPRDHNAIETDNPSTPTIPNARAY